MSDTLCFDLDRLVVQCSVQRMLRLDRLTNDSRGNRVGFWGSTSPALNSSADARFPY